MIDQPCLQRDTFKIFNRQNRLLWSTPIDYEQWQNFALKFDVGKKCVAYPESPHVILYRATLTPQTAPSRSTTPSATRRSRM